MKILKSWSCSWPITFLTLCAISVSYTHLEEVGKPFLYEEELRSKNARLVELDTLLNIDGKGQAHAETVVAKSTRTSVLDSLKRPATPRSTEKKPKQHEEVR